MTGAQLREAFLKYFEEHGHTRVSSSSLIPAGDATLLFTNAGMVQFKDVFTGQEKRPYSRATTAQKCLRVSGKHNDLENVGYTARHHTFFEMLGNFSFGDYFKEDAIAFGWGFLTDVVKLPKNKLYVTIYLDDDEAYDIWRRVKGLPKEHISRLGEKDNFWSMGDTGPCGPCSEIHIDQGEAAGCGKPDCGPGCDCDRFLELWNLVFMQFDRDSEGKMTPLPRPSIDTGLGLERLAAVVQGKKAKTKTALTNWDSDLFLPVIHRVEALAGRTSGANPADTVAIRVIADHSRAAAFLISDGVFPSNEGRGYVLRRILRRAVRYGMALGLVDEPFLYDTAGVVIAHMSDAYPELSGHSRRVMELVKAEEERFQQTLGRGAAEFEQHAQKILQSKSKEVPGDVAFLLYDTYGFPLDVTMDMAREKGLTVDGVGFNKEMARQKERARHAREVTQAEHTKAVRDLDHVSHTEFTGYERMEDSGVIQALVKDGTQVQEVSAGDHADIVTDRTPFYGESGGQVGDRGVIAQNGNEVTVETASKPLPSLILHRGLVKSGRVKVGDRVSLKVDQDLRRDTMANHSATHILQWALRAVLGDHVHQSGSVVDPERLRFDFSHFAAMTPEEIEKVETLVNSRIRENAEVNTKVASIEDALKEGATALFGEKYGDRVRVVSMGDYSKELCGGTHARRTGDIGLFKVVSEGGIAAGVRRIEAVTGRRALAYVRALENELRELADRLRGSQGELVRKVDKLLEDRRTKDREIETLKSKLASGAGTDLLDGVREVNGVKVLAKLLDNVTSPKDLREYADRVRDRLGSGVALLGASADGRVLLTALVTKDLVGRFHAGNIVKKAAEVVGGSGGGRPDMAQAGGPDLSNLEAALKTVDEFLS
ncbi:MAG: alanine--tRNA ligase [Thermodesulfobacteriota bacterium]